jgi:receptor protein-tyrosine kinase
MAFSREREERQMGTLLVEAGKLSAEDAEKVLLLQHEQGLRFGEAAIRLGLVSRADVDQVLAKQFEYPYLIPGQSSIAPEVVAAYEPFSPRVEELRALRAQLMLRRFGAPGAGRALAIIGNDTGGGRSYLVANLAVVFSQLGQRTVLVDADMRASRQHELFGIANPAGLSTILAGRGDISVIQRIASLVDLSVLTAGPVPPNPSELLDRPALSVLIEQLAGIYDVVLLDTSAVDRTTDAHSVAIRAGAALIVVHRYRTRLKAVQALAAALPKTEILGIVLNDF